MWCKYTCAHVSQRQIQNWMIWTSWGGSTIVTIHYSPSFVHFSNNAKNFPFVYKCSSCSKFLPHSMMPCLEHFTSTHWSLAAQTHDLELPPGFSEILESCAGSVFPHLSNATLHGFSPQDTRSHVIETGGHRCVNLAPRPFLSGRYIAFCLPVNRSIHLEKLLIAIWCAKE